MFTAAILFASLAFAETKTLAVQICLDREGFSVNTIDGQWGVKSQRALEAYCRRRGEDPQGLTPEAAYDRFFSDSGNLFRQVTVTADDLAALTVIPAAPAERAKLDRMGYESVKEMLAERGHLSQRAMERMNPGVDWDHVRPGLKLVIPDFPSIESDLDEPSRNPGWKRLPKAERLTVSLGNCEIRAYDHSDRLIALFPCSIASNQAKLPKTGERKLITVIPWPNYTYTPDYTPPGAKVSRHIWPAGPNCPIGVAWMGLDLPGYGIHGTVRPESIGNAESHGCFRLANWNAARLFAMVRPGIKVEIIE